MNAQADQVIALLRRARNLLAAGEGVAEPDWFDWADELVDEIDVALEPE